MVKFMVIFHKPADSDAFENVYNDFLALIERMPGVTRRQVINILGSPLGDTNKHRILEVYFDEQAQMEESLRSRAGQEAGGELRRFPAGSFEMLFAEVFEEAGGHTPTGGSSNANA